MPAFICRKVFCHSGARRFAANPESRGKDLGACFWIPGPLAFARVPE